MVLPVAFITDWFQRFWLEVVGVRSCHDADGGRRGSDDLEDRLRKLPREGCAEVRVFGER